MQLTRNQPYLYGYRGFESLSLRHKVFIVNNLKRASETIPFTDTCEI
jgi:hypothetical protein